MFVKAITISRHLNPFLPVTIDKNILLNILNITQTLSHSIVYQSLYLLCEGETSFFSSESVVIIIKLSKTLHDRHKVTIVTIPALGNSTLCPV